MLRHTRLLLPLLVCVALFVIGAVLLSAANSSRTSESGETLVQVRIARDSTNPDQPLQIERFTYHRTSNSLIDVEVGIKNITSTTQHGFVWYILAPAGSEEPWREARYSAPEQTVSLEPGMSELHRFDPPDTIAEGDYDLSVWIHGYREQERVHSDGAGAEASLYIGPPFTLEVTAVDRIEQIDGSLALEITLEASNHSGAAIDAELLFTIIAARETGSLSGLPEYIGSSYRTELGDGERATSTLRGAVRLDPGVYSVIGWLRRRDTDAVIQRVVSTTVINIE